MKKERVNFYKYFPVSEEDTSWGVFIENVGSSVVLEGENYPLIGHPNTHYFTWEKGRYLSGYQLLLIADGRGVFESETMGIISLSPGSMILLCPNVWHRYRPLKKTGWKEYWIGFDGDLASRLVKGSVFNDLLPILMIKEFQEIQNLFDIAVSYSIEEKPGFQQIVVGILLQIFGHVQYNIKNKTKQSRSFMNQINLAKELMKSNKSENLDVPKIAQELNIGYALFRKKFKEFTGMSPKQYQMQFKLNQAKSLLLGTDMPVKIIAFETGFESIYHFSKVFKEKTGSSPSQYRQIVMDSNKSVLNQ
jgi:AraC-like DNA-binding protein